MANVAAAVEFTLRLEDATLSGAVSDIPGDAGGKTRFGIASAYHPALLMTTFYTTMSTVDALDAATRILSRQYATPMQLVEWDSQTLANIVLAFAVNAGVETAVKALQTAINDLLPIQTMELQVDGILGQHTLSEMHRCMPFSLCSAFRLRVIEHYAEHANENVLRGLIRRALA